MRSSVVVVTFRPDEWLIPALESVASQADEVILVANGAVGDAASIAAKSVGAQLVQLDKNVGFAGGSNAGLRAATGDVLALLNDDAVASSGWLRHSSALLEDPSVGVVAPKLLLMSSFAELIFDDDSWYADGDPRRLGRMLHRVTVAGREVLPQVMGGVHRLEHGQLAGAEQTWRWTFGRDAIYVPLLDPSEANAIIVDGISVTPRRITDLVNNAGSYLSKEGHGGDYGWETPDDGAFEGSRDCFAACGAAMVFTRRTFEEVGSLPERFFAYYEDIDWCWRAQLKGLRVVYEPSAVVRHVRSATSGGEAELEVRVLSGRNRLHTLARNAPLPVLVRQLLRLRNPDLPRELPKAAWARALEGLRDRVGLRRGWRRSPAEVWRRWAGVDERWPDSGATAPRAQLPPKVQFGE